MKSTVEIKLNWFYWVCRAFDTLAKALNPVENSAGEAMEASMHLVSGDQSGSVVELEGPLLSDMHVPFKVKEGTRPLNLSVICYRHPLR